MDWLEKRVKEAQTEQENLIKSNFGDIEKARGGVYEDNPENRKLGRVGQRYGSKKKEEVVESKSKKEVNVEKLKAKKFRELKRFVREEEGEISKYSPTAFFSNPYYSYSGKTPAEFSVKVEADGGEVFFKITTGEEKLDKEFDKLRINSLEGVFNKTYDVLEVFKKDGVDSALKLFEKSETADFESFTEDLLLKARVGIYEDTPENRKLGRVGQKYGSQRQEEEYFREKTSNGIETYRIDNDVNGNPRYVIHFLDIAGDYETAKKRANFIGGGVYRDKRFGGGFVFQSHNIDNVTERILEMRKKTKSDISKSETFESFTNDLLLKARGGVYEDTSENRKLGRVGQRYGSQQQNEKNEPPKVNLKVGSIYEHKNKYGEKIYYKIESVKDGQVRGKVLAAKSRGNIEKFQFPESYLERGRSMANLKETTIPKNLERFRL